MFFRLNDMVASGPYQGQVDTGQGSSAPQAAPHMCKACAWWKLGPSLWPRQWGPMEEGPRGVMDWTVGAWDFKVLGQGRLCLWQATYPKPWAAITEIPCFTSIISTSSTALGPYYVPRALTECPDTKMAERGKT